MPSEELILAVKGGDYGWPYCYYDPQLEKLVLAPEYGGDGKKVGECAQKLGPAAAYPAHWAPNGLTFYGGDRLPEKYRGGAFIAFHGSWNRAPEPQAGYNVVFQPFSGGKPSGDYEMFADGFAGPRKQPGLAKHRPSGLAVGSGRRPVHQRRHRTGGSGGWCRRAVKKPTPPSRAERGTSRRELAGAGLASLACARDREPGWPHCPLNCREIAPAWR